MVDLFQVPESQWERAKKRHVIFTDIWRDLIIGVLTALLTLGLFAVFGLSLQEALACLVVAVAAPFVLPILETTWWWIRLPRLEAEEEADKLKKQREDTNTAFRDAEDRLIASFKEIKHPITEKSAAADGQLEIANDGPRLVRALSALGGPIRIAKPRISFQAFGGRDFIVVLSNDGDRGKIRVRAHILNAGMYRLDHQAPYEVATLTIKNGDSDQIVLATYSNDHFRKSVWVNSYGNYLESWQETGSYPLVLTMAVEAFHVTDIVESIGRRVYEITMEWRNEQLQPKDVTP